MNFKAGDLVVLSADSWMKEATGEKAEIMGLVLQVGDDGYCLIKWCRKDHSLIYDTWVPLWNLVPATEDK